jgi:L-alanine-DL-glutamate epimerase-like enolase superfamily enzyme
MSKIISIETAHPEDIMPSLLLVRVTTDDGLVGHGETYYTPHVIAALIHDWMAERLLGANALAVEAHWRFLYERSRSFGQPGAEMRALSAVDLALWDILGQACGQPVWQLLGGAVRKSVRIYNTCGGPSYGAKGAKPKIGSHGWSGFGDEGESGPLQDNWASFHAAGDLAEELVGEGIGGMKLWPFDRFAHASGGQQISWADVEAGMKPLREIRERVGNQIEIMIEGHAFFQLPAALRLADALREIQPCWLEDILPLDNLDTLADFRRQSRLPISASEMLLTRNSYLELLQKNAADYVMLDPTWCGGISESRRIIQLAETFNVPATLHDCTGPLTLFAGLHLAAAHSNVAWQETVRAHIRTFYDQLIDELPVIKNGHVHFPTGNGLGVKLHDKLFQPGQREYRKSC